MESAAQAAGLTYNCGLVCTSFLARAAARTAMRMPLQGVNPLMSKAFSRAPHLVRSGRSLLLRSGECRARRSFQRARRNRSCSDRSRTCPAGDIRAAPAAAPSEWQILGSQWEKVGPDLLHQQKEMWLFPVSLAHGHHWKPALALIGTTALLTTIDAHDAKWVRNNTQPLGGFNNTFAGYNTATATEAFASAFYLVGIARRNAYDQQTFLLAGEAVIDSEILTTVMKDIDGREAPITYPAGGTSGTAGSK